MKRIVGTAVGLGLLASCGSTEKEEWPLACEGTQVHEVEEGENLAAIVLENVSQVEADLAQQSIPLEVLVGYVAGRNTLDSPEVIHPEDRIELPEICWPDSK